MNLASLLESGAKDLGPRFNLVGVLPTVMLFMFVVALYWSGAPQRSPKVRAVVEHVEQVGGKEGIMLALGVLLFALLVQPLQLSLVRVLEGYWDIPLLPSVGAMLREPGIRWHKHRRGILEDQTQVRTVKGNAKPTPEEDDRVAKAKARAAAADWQLRRRYPAPDRLLPTALGNVLRAAEDMPYDMYCLDAVVVWPRLYPLLPQNMIAILADRRNQLDLAARFSAVFLLCAIISVFFLYSHRWWLLVPAIMLVLARLAYRGAVAVAVAYGESVQTSFDLYRLELYKALRIEPPKNLKTEKATNKLISDFLRQGIDTDIELLAYERASPDK